MHNHCGIHSVIETVTGMNCFSLEVRLCLDKPIPAPRPPHLLKRNGRGLGWRRVGGGTWISLSFAVSAFGTVTCVKFFVCRKVTTTTQGGKVAWFLRFFSSSVRRQSKVRVHANTVSTYPSNRTSPVSLCRRGKVGTEKFMKLFAFSERAEEACGFKYLKKTRLEPFLHRGLDINVQWYDFLKL